MSPLIQRIRRSSTIGSEVRSELDEAPVRPTHEEVVTAIMEEARAREIPCTYEEAASVFTVVVKAVDQSRKGDPYYLLSPEEMDTVHRVMDIVMPDDTVPVPGSAYEKMQLSLLRRHEIAIVHTKDEVDNCVLELHLATAA